jgi:nitroreductase
MWLSCTAEGIGSYWASPKSILEAKEFLQLQEGERCLGLFFMGYHNAPETDRKRIAINEKTIWL